jgi:hypothetical protein
MDFTRQAQILIQQFIDEHVGSGQHLVAIDGTAGNGFDTAFLAEALHGRGRVVAVDIHPTAIANTQQRIAESGLEESVYLYRGCHSHLDSVLDELELNRVTVAMFNLGYLPYCQDPAMPTQAATTIQALQKTFERLEGIMTVLAYIGHPGGKEESLAIESWVAQLQGQAQVEFYRDENPVSPTLWVIRN